MLNSAWCDLIGKGDTLKLHDKCPNCKCTCEKQIVFSPKQIQLQGSGSKHNLQIVFKGTRTAWKKFLEPAVNVAALFFGMAVGGRTKDPKVAQTTTKIF